LTNFFSFIKPRLQCVPLFIPIISLRKYL
jgi:hypothetical protein